MISQLLGALVGAALIYANYFHAIDVYEGGRGIRTQATGSLFSTYAVSLIHASIIFDMGLILGGACQLDYMTNVSAFFSEFLTSAVLMIAILAFTDPHNMAAPHGLLPLALFILILGIGIALGMQTGAYLQFIILGGRCIENDIGYAINPARDLGPRIMTAMVGYGSHVFTFRK
jgi:aquaglyceroporin related protein